MVEQQGGKKSRFQILLPVMRILARVLYVVSVMATIARIDTLLLYSIATT